MSAFSTREAAEKLGIDPTTLSRYIAAKKVPEPTTIRLGRFRVHAWTEAEIEHVRRLLPKIANGRKTRYKKKLSAVSNQQSDKTKKKTQARVPAPHKKK
jgi:predicted DNA-binding transcriptional regulator AlpA